MPKVNFAQSDGITETVDAEAGHSLMVAAITNGVDGIDAECGGGLVCGTCHVYVDDAWLCRVGRPSADEEDILDGVKNARPCSRLACQITMTDALDGLVVTVPHRSL